MSPAPTMAQMLSEVSVAAVAGVSAAGSGLLPKSELPLPPEDEAPAAPAGAGLGELPVSGAWALSVLELLVSVLVPLPEVSVEPVPEPPLVSVLEPAPLLPLPEVSVLEPPLVSVLVGPGWKSELGSGVLAGAWPGQVSTEGSQ
jgi:hypothetical protein